MVATVNLEEAMLIDEADVVLLEDGEDVSMDGKFVCIKCSVHYGLSEESENGLCLLCSITKRNVCKKMVTTTSPVDGWVLRDVLTGNHGRPSRLQLFVGFGKFKGR